MCIKYKHEGFRPDKETGEILKFIQTKGYKKSEFIKDAIKYYFKHEFINTDLDGKGLEKKLDEIKRTLISELKLIKADVSLNTSNNIIDEHPENNKELTRQERDDLIFNIGNAFAAWGEPIKTNVSETVNNNYENEFADEDEVDI